MKKQLNKWRASELMDLLDLKSKTPLFYAEKKGAIPTATRIGGKTRVWDTADIPTISQVCSPIGKKEGLAEETTVITVFTVKGGVTKTTTSYNFSRYLALLGYKVLLCGNDPQGSISGVTLSPLYKNLSIDQLPTYSDLGEVICNTSSLEDAIEKTDLPTLDFLPETDGLTKLEDFIIHVTKENAMKMSPSRLIPPFEYYNRFLVPKVREMEYDFMIIDNGPQLSLLNKNALVCADYWITPNSCDQGSVQVFQKNFTKVLEFAEEVGKVWKDIVMLPTLRDNTNLSNDIYSSFQAAYPDFISKTSVYKTIKAQESAVYGVTPMEMFPKSQLAEETKKFSLEMLDTIKNSSGERTSFIEEFIKTAEYEEDENEDEIGMSISQAGL